MRSRARLGMRCTKPRRSWLESRNPIPRPIPLSKYDAERERLKVIMVWYGFQMLTMRFVWTSGVRAVNVSNRPSQCPRKAAKASAVSSAFR